MTTYQICGECHLGLSAHAMCVTCLQCPTHQYVRAVMSLPDDGEFRDEPLVADREGCLVIAPGAPPIRDLWLVANSDPNPIHDGLQLSTNSGMENGRREHIAELRRGLFK